MLAMAAASRPSARPPRSGTAPISTLLTLARAPPPVPLVTRAPIAARSAANGGQVAFKVYSANSCSGDALVMFTGQPASHSRADRPTIQPVASVIS